METKATLKVVRTRVKRVLMYSMIENATLSSFPWTQVTNCISKGTIFVATLQQQLSPLPTAMSPPLSPPPPPPPYTSNGAVSRAVTERLPRDEAEHVWAITCAATHLWLNPKEIPPSEVGNELCSTTQTLALFRRQP